MNTFVNFHEKYCVGPNGQVLLFKEKIILFQKLEQCMMSIKREAAKL